MLKKDYLMVHFDLMMSISFLVLGLFDFDYISLSVDDANKVRNRVCVWPIP